MIDEKDFAYGVDVSRHQYSQDGSQKMDFKKTALHKDPTVTVVASRAGISWGYQDPWFVRNWQETRAMDRYRDEAQYWDAIFGLPKMPVGRAAYHVIYPGEDAKRQSDNFFRITGELADWTHDRAVIDLELDHGQSRRRITDCTLQFARFCQQETGRWPILYARTLWLNHHTYPAEFSHLDLWLAQYRWRLPTPLYTPEYAPPPNPLPIGIDTWMIHQTGERGNGSALGAASRYIDENRWNGSPAKVANYFGYDIEAPPIEHPVMPWRKKVMERLDRLEEEVFGEH